jgi:hypothetical protein
MFPERQPHFLRSGTYLQTFCPACDAGLTHGNWVHLAAVDAAGAPVALKLSPRFNVFDKEATARLEKGSLLRDLLCPHCQRSLVLKTRCEACGAPAAGLRVVAYDVSVDFLICTRTGCPWHALAEEDCARLAIEEDGDPR